MTYDEVFRTLAVGDIDLTGRKWAEVVASVECLDPRTASLVRVGALVALGASECAFSAAVDDAVSSGATADDVVGVLLELAPVVGTARLVDTAPALGSGLGIDVEHLLETSAVPKVER